MANVVELTDANFRDELKKHKLALVDYYASWCGSCRLFAPAFAKVGLESSSIPFFKIDGDAHPKSREGLNVDNLPFVAIFENGEPVGGMSISTEDALRNLLKRVEEKAASL